MQAVNVAKVDKATGKILNVIVVDKDLPAEKQAQLDPAFDWIEESAGTGPASINGNWDGTLFGPAPDPYEGL